MENQANVHTTHTEKIGKLATALCAVHSKIPVIPKNRDGYGYKYADINDLLGAVLPILHEAGLSLIQSMEVHNSQPYMMTMILHGESDQWIKGYTRMFMAKADSQGVGSSITYAKRYGLSSMLAIASDEDTDGVDVRDAKTQATSKKAAPVATPVATPPKQQAYSADPGPCPF